MKATRRLRRHGDAGRKKSHALLINFTNDIAARASGRHIERVPDGWYTKNFYLSFRFKVSSFRLFALEP